MAHHISLTGAGIDIAKSSSATYTGTKIREPQE